MNLYYNLPWCHTSITSHGSSVYYRKTWQAPSTSAATPSHHLNLMVQLRTIANNRIPSYRTIAPSYHTITPSHRTIAPSHRTIAPYHRTIAPYHRTVPSHHRSVPSHHRTILSHHRTVPSHRTIAPLHRTIAPSHQASYVPDLFRFFQNAVTPILNLDKLHIHSIFHKVSPF